MKMIIYVLFIAVLIGDSLVLAEEMRELPKQADQARAALAAKAQEEKLAAEKAAAADRLAGPAT